MEFESSTSGGNAEWRIDLQARVDSFGAKSNFICCCCEILPRRPIRSETVIFVCFPRKLDFWVIFSPDVRNCFFERKYITVALLLSLIIKTELN